jgi:hypothetical protein
MVISHCRFAVVAPGDRHEQERAGMDDDETGRRLDAMMRRLNDNHEAVLASMAAFRDDMTVQSAIIMRMDGTLSALITEIRAMHARQERLSRRVDGIEKPPAPS